MKKIMSLMLGMSLVIGAASFAFAQADTSKKDDKSTETKKKGGKKKGTDSTDAPKK